MSLPPLTVIPAGAGSGKTYTLQQQLGQWVEQGQAAPERIVAVTFTEAELRAAVEADEQVGHLISIDVSTRNRRKLVYVALPSTISAPA